MLFFPLRRRLTARALDQAYESALNIEAFSPETDSYVVISDVHKADRGGSDDFKHNEMIMLYALRHYLENDFRLVLAGDIEEAWESSPEEIAAQYGKTVFALERKFNEKGKNYYIRLLGNHDDFLARPGAVRGFLEPLVGPLQVHPALKLGKNIFVVHGHQGELFSYHLAFLGKAAARFIWKPLQIVFGLTVEPFIENQIKRNNRDRLLSSWAESRGMLLISGHHHRAVFKSKNETHFIREAIDRVKKSRDEFDLAYILPYLQHKLQVSRKWPQTKGAPSGSRYFNCGCAVYRNGLTAIEITGGQIRLVKWEYSDSYPRNEVTALEKVLRIERRVFASESLSELGIR